MYPWLRWLRVVVRARLGRALEPLAESRIRFRVGVNDLDFNGHVNNGRYLTIMDLGRVDLIVRLGLLRVFRRRKWFPVVAAATVRFAKPLRWFQGYEVRTRVVAWDERWFFLEQRWVHGDSTACLAWLKTGIRSRTGRVTPAECLAARGFTLASPALPPEIAAWGASPASGPVRS